MAPNAQTPADGSDTAADLRAGRRKAARYVVPIAVAGVAAATIAAVPALANAGGPDLPKITAQQLIEKIAASDVQQFSGTAKISTDLGLPSLAGGLLGGLGGGAGPGGGDGAPSPEQKLTELATGTHTVRVAADGPDRQKLTFLDGRDEYSLIHNGQDVWGWDSKSKQVFHERSEGAAEHRADKKTADRMPGTPQELAQEALKAAGTTTTVSVGDTAQVAGRSAYQLVLTPKQSGSTVGSVQIAVDAKNGVPLRFRLLAAGGGKPIVDAGFTKVDFSKPGADTFAFTPPKGAKVTEGGEEGDGAGHEKWAGPGMLDAVPGLGGLTGGAAGEGPKDVKVLGEGWASIARIEVPGGKGLNAIEEGKDVPKEAGQFLDALGDKVSGKFGQGRVFSTRLVNALITDDGKVYVGAVTKDTLVKAADSAK